MLSFEEFFPVEFPEKTKVKFNMNAGNVDYPAWDYLRDDAIEWNNMNAHKTIQANNNLNRADYLLAFAQYYPYGCDYYIFGGMYKVEKIIPEVYELAPSTKLGSFPGYNNVLLTHRDLQMITKLEAPEWRTALSNVKGVYCITDKSTGQLYIGSATGNSGGIWQRWSAYADVSNLTGGNKTFEELKNNGADYIIDNFIYSILEIFDMKTKREDIIHREEYWKRVFQTVKHGMNNAGKGKKN